MSGPMGQKKPTKRIPIHGFDDPVRKPHRPKGPKVIHPRDLGEGSVRQKRRKKTIRV